jgi:hypothetical protein
MIKLISGLNSGCDSHRSGWPAVTAALAEASRPKGLWLDDFVERTFLPRDQGHAYRRPWIGIFHHPPNMPVYFRPERHAQCLWNNPEFRLSLKTLRGAVALSQFLATWLAEWLHVPTIAIKYPCGDAGIPFNLNAFLQHPRLAQVGWYLKNQDAIYQVPVPDGVEKIHVRTGMKAPRRAEAETRASGIFADRKSIGQVRVLPKLPNDEYDQLLASSVLFAEYLDVSGSTVLVEAIARRTPIVVNRLPAIEEYLGAAYPLFYRSLSEVPSLLPRVAEAHEYLSALDVSWLSVAAFVDAVTKFARAVK